MKVFLLEGCDGAGKTTLAGHLDNMSGASYIEHLHFSQPKTDSVWIEYAGPIIAAAARISLIDEDGWLIIDRAHISEMVYGPMFRGRVIGKRWEWRKLEKLLDDLNTTRLFVNPGRKTIQKRLKARGDEFVNMTQAYQLSLKYNQLLLNNPKWTRVDAPGQALLEALAR